MEFIRKLRIPKLAQRKSFIDYGPFLLILVAGSIFFFYYFLEYFVLVEAKCWINGGAGREGFTEVIFALWEYFKKFFEMPAFTRYFSIAFVDVTGAICKYDSSCINFPQIILILAAGGLAFFLLRQLGVGPIVASVPVLLWFFSLPVLDAVHWQATSHDKTAVFMMLASLNVALYYFKKNNNLKNILLGNLNVGLMVIFTYNTKEAAWAIGPSLLFLAYIYSRFDAENSFKSNLKIIVLSLLYGFIFSIRHVYRLLTGPADAHVLSADPVENFIVYLGYFVNSQHVDLEAHNIVLYLTICSLFLLVLIYIFLIKKQKNIYRQQAYVLIWLFLTFSMSIIVALQTHYKSAFYMLVPSIFIYMFVVNLAVLSWMLVTDILKVNNFEIHKKINIAVSFAIFISMTGIVLHYLNDFRSQFKGYYKYFILPSRNLTNGVSVIRGTIKDPFGSEIHVSYPKTNHVGFMFVGRGCTYSFLFDVHDPGEMSDKKITYYEANQLDELSDINDKGYFIEFTHDLSLKSIYKGKNQLYMME